jgi:CO/xanthine dehydrogenase Mo-binding subunit
VWTHSQGIFPLRDAIAKSCALDASRVVVHHVEGAGCYGHNSADDVAFDAVLLARETPGRPVQVVWSRDDEFAWEPYGPAMAVEIAVGVDTSGDIVQWRQDVWGNGHVTRPGYDGNIGLLGASEAAMQTVLPAAVDPASYGGGNSRNAVPPYRVRDLEATVHRLLAMPIRTSSMRSLGAMMNVFAIESIIDELAELAEADPVEYRLRQLPDERARAVVAAAAELAGWKDRKSSDGWGWGIAYARYKNTHAHCAAVARVEAVSSVEVRNIYVAVDAGQIVNPDGLANQVEGGAVQAASWAVREAISFDDHEITSRDWESYPILRFSEAPTVSVTLLPRPDEPSLGVGECAAGPVAGAIANALYDAIGVRVRDLPLTPERIEAAILQD